MPELRCGSGSQRWGVVVALAEITAHGCQERGLCSGLDTLSHHGEPQLVRQADDGLDDGAVVAGGTESGDEGAVDLYPVDRVVAQMAQVAVAGAEVVDGQPDAELLESTQHVARLVRGFEHGGLGRMGIRFLREASSILTRNSTQTEPFGWPG